MENFDRENIDELLEICQIRQYFPPSKFCAVQYFCYKRRAIGTPGLIMYATSLTPAHMTNVTYICVFTTQIIGNL